MKTAQEVREEAGKQLRAARKAKGLSLLDVAGKLKVDIKDLSVMENGRRNSKIDSYYRYAEFLGLEMRVVFE